jgi:hypothetical protein
VINNIFDTLDDWRFLPGYQLERRADIFFALHLKYLFDEIFGHHVTEILPEFPIRKGTIVPEIPINKSYKVDYAVFSDNNKVFLVELKTDDGSTREEQYAYYFKAIDVGFKNIVDGVLLIFEATDSKSKYQNLLGRLRNNGSIIIKDGKDVASDKYSFYDYPIFLKPNKLDTDRGQVIDFKKIANILKISEDNFTKRFVESLVKWTVPV